MNRILAASLALAFAGTALAGNVHLKGGGKAEVAYASDSDSVSITTCLSGLGNGDLYVDIVAEGTAEVECENPGGNIAPGQDTDVGADGGIVIPEEEIKNGSVCFTVTTDPVSDDQLVDGEVCPNNSWDAHIISIDWTSAELFVYQGGTAQSPGDLVFSSSSHNL